MPRGGIKILMQFVDMTVCCLILLKAVMQQINERENKTDLRSVFLAPPFIDCTLHIDVAGTFKRANRCEAPLFSFLQSKQIVFTLKTRSLQTTLTYAYHVPWEVVPNTHKHTHSYSFRRCKATDSRVINGTKWDVQSHGAKTNFVSSHNLARLHRRPFPLTL